MSTGKNAARLAALAGVIGALAITIDSPPRSAPVAAAVGPSTAPAPPIAAPPSPPPSPTPPQPVRPTGDPVTIAFGGDVHFEGGSVRALSGALAPLQPWLSAADLTVVNLETAITERGTPYDKAYTFRAPAEALTELRRAGIDVANAANNHGMDFGVVGLYDTLHAETASGLPLVGIGRDAGEAFAPYRATVRGRRIAVIGASHVIDWELLGEWSAGDGKPGIASAYDAVRLLGAVRQAERTSDTVVVYLHWGDEGKACPTKRQQKLARDLVTAGADVVVGSHAHLLLGAGRLGRAVVGYGLGNFIFYARRGSITSRTGLLTVSIRPDDTTTYAWSPAVIDRGIPQPLAGAAAISATRSWRRLRGCTGLAP